MKKILSILVFIVYLLIEIGCSPDVITEQVTYSPEPGVSLYFYQTRFAKISDSAHFYYQGKALQTSPFIKKHYTATLFKPLWTNALAPAPRLDTLIKYLQNARYYGLDSAFYSVGQISALKEQLADSMSLYNKLEYTCNLELLASNSCMLFMKHLSAGITDIDTIDYRKNKYMFSDTLAYLLKGVVNQGIDSTFRAVQPQSVQYQNLLFALERFLTNIKPDTTRITVPNEKEDSVGARLAARDVLYRNGYLFNIRDELSFYQNGEYGMAYTEAGERLMPEIPNDSLFVHSLQIFQKFHGLSQDGVVGSNTANALNMSNYDRYMKIAISLEKLRWEANLPGTMVWVNIPSYELKYYKNKQLARKFRVVVGLPHKKTPELDGQIEYFITYPDWNVPTSISAKELLPKIKSDSAYLEKHNYIVYDKDFKALNVRDMDWSKITAGNFDYRIKQTGGSHNSLGTIKFIFPNSHYVYIHDTPSKKLFKSELRAYSHGCVRLQQPLEFAEVLLEHENRSTYKDTLYQLMERHQNKQINMNKPMPVYIRYLTAEADESGNIYFLTDIYKKEDFLKQVFSEKSLALSVQSTIEQ